MTLGTLSSQLRDESGAVLVIVSAAMSALILLCAFVLDSANWFQHKRHLQLQVDAAALAGADSITLPYASCSNALIGTNAHNYGGPDATHPSVSNNPPDPNNPTKPYNAQVGATPASRMHILINSQGYYGDANAAEDLSGTNAPCNTSNEFCPGTAGIDVKGTESDLPWFFGGSLVPRINAHARVCLMQQSTSGNSLPIAVPNPKPKSAAAILINEAGGSNALLGVIPLNECLNPASPAPPTCPSAVSQWTSLGTDVTIAAQTGVVIAISGLPTFPSGSSLAEICGKPQTQCFDASSDPPTVGVSFIRGYDAQSGVQPNPPQLRNVQLFPGTCPGNPYFQMITTGCSVTLAAVVDSQLATGGNPRMNLEVHGAGCTGGAGCPMTKDVGVPPSTECQAVLASGAIGQCWKASIPIAAYAGAQRLTMNWVVSDGTIGTKSCATGGGCKGNFENGGYVQQAYTADDRPTSNISGPLARVQVLHCTSSTNCPDLDANALGRGTQKISIAVDLNGALRNAADKDDATARCVFPDNTIHQYACLKVTVSTGGSGSTQSVNCDPLANPNKDLDDQLALGCEPEYVINTGTICPSANILEGLPQPWNCTELFTGNKTPLVSRGLNRRIFGPTGLLSTCTISSCTNPPPCPPYMQLGHNNWAMYNPADDTGNDGFPAGDPRIVGVYLTAYGAFTHTAGTSLTIPVTDFGTFYITGYDGSPCTTQAGITDHPDDPIPDAGTIVGHFIKYVDKLNSGGGTAPCDPNSFGACVPVMTK